MKTDSANELESLIGRELKGLPDLHAPPSLMPRVTASLASPAAQRRGWLRGVGRITLFWGFLLTLAWILFSNISFWLGLGRVSSRWSFWRTAFDSIDAAFTGLVGDLTVAVRLMGHDSPSYLLTVAAALAVVVLAVGSLFLHLLLKHRKSTPVLI